MNCIYQCEYCYLEGMYSSAYIVVFVNLEDFFSEVKALSKDENMYLCISYDTDILALENLLGYGKAWIEFLQDNPNGRKKRLALARVKISQGMSATQAGATSGFSDYSSFFRAFKNEYGVNPREFAAHLK